MFDIFLIFAQNIDCGYTLVPPSVRTASVRRFYPVPTIYVLEQKIRKIGIPCIPHFYYIKVGLKGVFTTRTCFPDET